MAATVQINEYNGVGGTKTSNITNSNYGSADVANLVTSQYPVQVGGNSYEKWQKLEVVSMGGSSSISQIKIWYTGFLGGSDTLVTNASYDSYAGAESYTQPVTTTSTVATHELPNSEPANPNLGIGGSLSNLITTPGESDFLVHQLQSDNNTLYGSSINIVWRYIEIA